MNSRGVRPATIATVRFPSRTSLGSGPPACSILWCRANTAATMPVLPQPATLSVRSHAAIEIAGRHADIYALWGEPLDEAVQTIAKVRAAAARYNRSLRFSLSVRPILAATEKEAWARADRI